MMDIKGTLKAITLELRRELEGKYDAQGTWQPGDLERRLASIGVWRDRAAKPVDELSRLAPEDRDARRAVDAFVESRREAGQSREAAIAEFVRDAAYTWANRLLALRCMEARGLIDEVILQKDAYGGRSLQHNRLAKKQPERCAGEDEGLFAALLDEYGRRAEELPVLFNPRAAEVALRPSVAAIKRCVALLSGTLVAKGQEAATDEIFTAADALGWTYQYWNTEEKYRVFEKVRTTKGAKIEGAELMPATCIYTEPYMVQFLVQNSLGAIWMDMRPSSRLVDNWEYFVRDAELVPIAKKAVADITFLDPACGSGHFLIEAFDLFYAMYVEEASLIDPAEICASILERNLYGIDIDERATQIAALALVMKAKEKAPYFVPRRVNLASTNIRLPAGKEHLDGFLRKHPEDVALKPALLAIFEGLAHADEFGSLLQIEEPVDRELRHLRSLQIERERKAGAGELFGPRKEEDWAAWKRDVVDRLRDHFKREANDTDLANAFFGEAATKGLSLVDLLARRYDVVAANPPYASFRNVGELLATFLRDHYPQAPTDTYSAMLWRALDLLAPGGRVAFVTQDGLLLLPSLSELRHRMLVSTQLEVVAHLGPHAFADVSGEKVSVALTIAHAVQPTRPPVWIRLVNSLRKDAELRKAVVVGTNRMSNGLMQAEYLRTRSKQWLYFAPRRLVDILANQQTLESIALVKQGIITGANDRYVRYWWEVPSFGGRWQWYFFSSDDILWGAGGRPLHVVDWRDSATWRFVRPRAEELRFREGIAFGRLGREFRAAHLPPNCLFDVNASSALFHSKYFEKWVYAYLSAPLIAALLRALNVSLTFLIQDVAGVPIPADISAGDCSVLDGLAQRLLELRAALAARAPHSADFHIVSEGTAGSGQTERVLLDEIDTCVERVLGLTDVEADALRELAAAVVSADDTDGESDEGPDFDDNLGAPAWLSHEVLRLLGHRWPGDEPGKTSDASVEADQDGIVPLTEGASEMPLIGRLRRCGLGGRSEQDLARLLGMSLDAWLSDRFFSAHISQFKKRPAVWQVQSGPVGGGRRRGRGVRKAPAFAALIYYRAANADLLPKLRTQYVGPLRSRLETELGVLSKVKDRTADQDSRRLELEEKIAELREFDNRLEQVIVAGFASPFLDKIAQDEALDEWTSRDGSEQPPESSDVFLAQERRYDPDLNDGIRVNIAPLQRAGLLAADVLAPKDVEKAIADRAVWRRDERCWCREGQLSRPGWWPETTYPAQATQKGRP
jgi:hypothetical protein